MTSSNSRTTWQALEESRRGKSRRSGGLFLKPETRNLKPTEAKPT